MDNRLFVGRIKTVSDLASYVESILQCDRIGLTIEEFCELAVESMRGVSDELGL